MLFRVGYRIIRWIVATVVSALGGLKVEGREHLPHGGVLVAANHVSYLDPPVVGLAIGHPIWYMAKEPLFRVPFLGALMRFFHAFPVRPDAPDRTALRRSEEILTAGETLLIFPEGSCSRDEDLLPFRPGLAMIALRAGVPIVPTAVRGTQRALPPDAYRPRRVPEGLEVRFGAPIHPDDLPAGLDRKEQIEELTRRVEAAIRQLLGTEAKTIEPQRHEDHKVKTQTDCREGGVTSASGSFSS
jgi:1-acyl-sn-glycerol-3-phosphate acyltransferase